MRTLALAVALAISLPLWAEESRKSVTLDAKDAEARDVLRSLQKQCGVRNLMIDPDVTGSGTFYFREVPCETAFRVVFRTLGVVGKIHSNSVVTVSRR